MFGSPLRERAVTKRLNGLLSPAGARPMMGSSRCRASGLGLNDLFPSLSTLLPTWLLTVVPGEGRA